MAGMSKGSGTRSGLLWEVERILHELKETDSLPQILCCENVPQIVSKKNKPDFELWCKSLSDLGYFSTWRILNAKDYGVPQNRNRFFMLSFLGKDYEYEWPEPVPLTRRLKDVLEDNVDEKYYINSGKGLFPTVCAGTHGYGNPHVAAETDIKERFFRQAVETMEKGNAAPGDTVDAFNRKVNRSGVSPTLTTRPEGFKTAILPVVEARPKAAAAPLHSDCLRKYRIRKLTPKECFRLMAVTDNDADKMLSVNSNSQCYKQAGNSIVVSVLEAIFRQLNIKGVEAWNKEKVA